MTIDYSKWLRLYYKKITGSIAFFPALIAIMFLLLSWNACDRFFRMGKRSKVRIELA